MRGLRNQRPEGFVGSDGCDGTEGAKGSLKAERSGGPEVSVGL